MNEYLLILRDEERRWEEFSPEEMQRIIGLFAAWNRKLVAEERYVTAGKLKDGDLGVTVRSRGGEFVVDGPFSEAKEAIGGFYCLRAGSMEEAARVAQECPVLSYGGVIEVRELESTMRQDET